MQSEPGEHFDVAPEPDAVMQDVSAEKPNKEKKQVIVLKSKTEAELRKLASAKQRKRVREERALRKAQGLPPLHRVRKRKATPKRKRKPAKRSPKKVVRRKKAAKKKKER